MVVIPPNGSGTGARRTPPRSRRPVRGSPGRGRGGNDRRIAVPDDPAGVPFRAGCPSARNRAARAWIRHARPAWSTWPGAASPVRGHAPGVAAGAIDRGAERSASAIRSGRDGYSAGTGRRLQGRCPRGRATAISPWRQPGNRRGGSLTVSPAGWAGRPARAWRQLPGGPAIPGRQGPEAPAARPGRRPPGRRRPGRHRRTRPARWPAPRKPADSSAHGPKPGPAGNSRSPGCSRSLKMRM